MKRLIVLTIIIIIYFSGCVLQQQSIELKIGDTKSIQVVSQPTVIKLVRINFTEKIADFSIYDPRDEETSKYNLRIKIEETKTITNTYKEYFDITVSDIKTESVIISLKVSQPSSEGIP